MGWPATIEKSASKTGFTLVELLVVIAIIVILLALLVGGLERALKAAERSKCGANQKSLAQTALIYSNENYHTLPPRGGSPDSSIDFRDDTTNPTPVQGSTAAPNPNPAPWPGAISPAARGLGRMVVTGHLPNSKLGEMIHCPSLDTTSAVPVRFGMDELYNDSPQSQRPSSQQGVSTTAVAPAVNDTVACAGGSYWNDQANRNRRIVSSYNYRAMSYAATKGGANILTNKVGATFALTCDLVTNQTAANAGGSTRRYGRPFHHRTGWNVSYADGHVSYVQAEPSANNVKDGSRVETDILGNGTVSNIEMNGYSDPGRDERVFDYFKTR